jgi:hypothetical protein
VLSARLRYVPRFSRPRSIASSGLGSRPHNPAGHRILDYVARHIIVEDRAWRVPSPLQLGRVPHLLRLTGVGRVVRKVVRMRFPSVDEECIGTASILAR